MGRLRIVEDKNKIKKGKRFRPTLASTKWKIISAILYTLLMIETGYIISEKVDVDKYIKLIESHVWQIKDLF